jgi:hypothetical protein
MGQFLLVTLAVIVGEALFFVAIMPILKRLCGHPEMVERLTQKVIEKIQQEQDGAGLRPFKE